MTGAGGQLGRALAESFADSELVALSQGLGRDASAPGRVGRRRPCSIAAAWTDVDAAEDDPKGRPPSTSVGRRTPPRWGRSSTTRPTTCSTGASRRRTSSPARRTRCPRTAVEGTRQRRPRAASRGSCARPGSSARPGGTSCERCSDLGRERDEVAVVDRPAWEPDVRRTPRRGDDGDRDAPHGIYHAAAGDCTGAELPHRSSRRRGSTAASGASPPQSSARPATRPAYSVLRSDKPETPVLPNWRQGLRECLARVEWPITAS